MSRTAIQDATDRLRALATLQPLSSQIYMTGSELFRQDMTIILDELHRLHIVVADQRDQLERKRRSTMRPKSLITAIQRHSENKHASGQPKTHKPRAPRPPTRAKIPRAPATEQ